MKRLVQFLFSRLSGSGLRMLTQQSLGPTPFAAMTPWSTPELRAADAGLIAVAAVVLLVLIAGIAVKLYARSQKREEATDRIKITLARLGRAA